MSECDDTQAAVKVAGFWMGWTLVASLFFGLYGFVWHPVVGIFGAIIPFLVKKSIDRRRADEAAAQARWQARQLNDLENKLRNRLSEKISDAVQTYRLTVKTSPMGIKDCSRFDREMVQFLEVSLTQSDLLTLLDNGWSLRDVYEQKIAADLHSTMEHHLTRLAIQPFHFVEGSPLDFEKHCAAVFRSCGWEVRETPASGDHGVDFIASRNGETLAIQCKLYSKPVGNSAVQEVAAGRIHYCADAALVVATNGYTEGAKVLAHSNGVELFHPDEIPALFGPLINHSTDNPKSGRHLDWPPRAEGKNRKRKKPPPYGRGF